MSLKKEAPWNRKDDNEVQISDLTGRNSETIHENRNSMKYSFQRTRIAVRRS